MFSYIRFERAYLFWSSHGPAWGNRRFLTMGLFLHCILFQHTLLNYKRLFFNFFVRLWSPVTLFVVLLIVQYLLIFNLYKTNLLYTYFMLFFEEIMKCRYILLKWVFFFNQVFIFCWFCLEFYCTLKLEEVYIFVIIILLKLI